MRTSMVLVAGALLTVMAGGCAGGASGSPDVATARSGGPDASSTPTASASVDPDAPLKYAKCMRENGMTWWPDPDSSGRSTIQIPRSVNQEDLKAAEKACRQWAPFNEDRPPMSAEDMEKFRAMSQCMRDNGVPNFPDPKPDGGIELNGDELGTGPGDPTFDKAEAICSKNMPQGDKRQQKNDGDGGSAVGGGTA